MTPISRHYCKFTLAAAFVLMCAARLANAVPDLPPGDLSRSILEQANVKGGLVVLLGCEDGELVSALASNERFVVQALEPDEKKAARACYQLLSDDNLRGRASVEQWTGKRLPYADNLVNLVVTKGECPVAKEEILRVLVPNGVALFLNPKSESRDPKFVKPRPKEIDEWTHFLHDAGNNAVARDSVVGPPRALQWVASPLWLRSHETPSGFEAMVAGGGRLFYLLDEGLVGITDKRLPERWSLLCRDAFNGKQLWKKPVKPWGWPEWAADKFQGQDWTVLKGARTVVPEENQRRLVVDGPRLYATLGYRAPLSILDAATGDALHEVAETAPARQFVSAEGVVVVYSQEGDAASERRRGKGKNADPSTAATGKLIAVEGSTGAVLWRQNIAPIRGLSLAIDRQRVVCQVGQELLAFELRSGKELWRTGLDKGRGITLVATEGIVLLLGQDSLEARDGSTGQLKWNQPVTIPHGLGGEDLFVADGLVWPALLPVDEKQEPTGKSPHVLAIGYDLRTGEERKRVFAENLRSPEHHHRCYRNKATEHYAITAMEGCEFVDLQGTGHSQNNFVRGSCRLGIMPCNGMLYAPPDQCFCEPGAKLLGFTAIGPASAGTTPPVPDDQRLERGPAYSEIRDQKSEIRNSEDWPTFRHDAARHGSTRAAVQTPVVERWKAKIGRKLTAPVCVGNQVLVASPDTHTVYALDLKSGQPDWGFTVGSRIDSPPTVHNGLVLFGCANGWVYCLRADEGDLVWKFLAAPSDRRILSFEQVESVWPVHGSVLVDNGIAYFTAGRSTYLDGGIRLYGLDPVTGEIKHQTVLSGPFPDGKTLRETSFHIPGANSDVLVSEGGSIYLRQKRFTPSLQAESSEELSPKGESDVGLHVFSTAGLLDDSWYNRTFWMYAKRWPGFQLANQAPKSGQLLVVDGATTYAVQPFYRRNLHSPMFFPGKEGYVLFADKNSNEPQIVGDKDARTPVPWLPQSDYLSSKGLAKLDSLAFGLDKMIGYTRAEPPLWKTFLPVRIRAMIKAGDTLFVAGPPDELPESDPYAAFEGRRGARLVAVSAADGQKQSELALDAPPVFDGMIAGQGCLLISQEDGSLVCLAKSM